jgi:hypothetical protein
MTKLDLNNNQRQKLLKMIKSFFPEIYSKDINKLDIRDGDDDNPCIMHNNGKNWDIIIPWFEFCCKHLAWKIYNKTNVWQDGQTTFNSFCGECIMTNMKHPVDYLYEQFLKLKL